MSLYYQKISQFSHFIYELSGVYRDTANCLEKIINET